jgi:tetratricopeptide (TPR) repeat protein
MRQTDIHFEKQKHLLETLNFLMDEKDSAVLAEKSIDQRAEQRLRYRWPVRFADGVNDKITQGQIVDVSSRGMAMLCHSDKHCPRKNQLVNIDFGVPHFGPSHSLDVVFVNRTGRVCRSEKLSKIVNRIAVKFDEPLFFKPGQQDISESEVKQILQAKTQSIIRTEEKAKIYGEALARTEHELHICSEAKKEAEERVKTEASARAMVEEKLRIQTKSISELQKKAKEYAEEKNRIEEIAKIEAGAREKIEEKLSTKANLIIELQNAVRAYAETKDRAEERVQIESRERKKAEENLRAEIRKRSKTEALMQDKINSLVSQIVKIKAESAEAVIWAKAEAEYATAKAKSESEQNDGMYAEAKIRTDRPAKIKTRIRKKAAIFILLMLVVGTLLGFYPKKSDNPVNYYNQGSIHLQKKQYDRAIFDYTRAIEISPGFAAAYYNRALAYYDKEEYEKAWHDVHKAEGLGYVIHPIFLKNLRKASGDKIGANSSD